MQRQLAFARRSTWRKLSQKTVRRHPGLVPPRRVPIGPAVALTNAHYPTVLSVDFGPDLLVEQPGSEAPPRGDDLYLIDPIDKVIQAAHPKARETCWQVRAPHPRGRRGARENPPLAPAGR